MTTILNSHPLQKIPLSSSDRLQQTYIIGANGVGKSTTLLKLILRDIANGYGVCVLDPHGDLISDVIACMQSRVEDVVLLSLTNPDLPFGLNLFQCDDPLNPLAVQNTVSTILNIFEKVYGVDRNTMARIINYLQALAYLFIHNSDITVLDIPNILDPSKDSEMLRLRLVQNLPDSPAYDYTRYFWTTYYDNRGYFGRDEELAGVFNKFREMTSVLLYPIFCQPNTIDFSSLMAQNKIVLCKLNSDWPDITSLVGSILIAQILHAGYIRKHTDPFFVYADEFQNFATADFARLFAEARKFKIGITISHQTLQQVPESIKDVVLQNAGTLIVFRIGNKDAKEIAGNFHMEPDPAWEEELTEEWIEVLEQVKHKRVEEDIIDGEKPVRIPKFNVIDHLLNVGHSNPAVAHFVMQYLQFFKEQADNYFDDMHPRLYISYGGDSYILYEGEAEQALRLLNNVLYTWMLPAEQNTYPIGLYEIEEAFTKMAGYPDYYTKLQYERNQKLLAQVNTDDQSSELALQLSFAASEEQLEREERRYHKFTNALWETLLALADQPIEVDSGQWEPRIRKQINYLTDPPLTLLHPRHVILHPQREYSVVADELINGLSSLPNFMACVKTRSGEYLVQTTPPPRGVPGGVFQQRVRQIQEHNLADGYVRLRSQVEQALRTKTTDTPATEIDTLIYTTIPDMKRRDTKKDILHMLYWFPYLTVDRVTLIVSTPGNIKRIYKHLSDLTTQQKLLRFRENLNDQYIYWLADAGRDILRGLGGYDFSKWKQPRKMELLIRSQDFTHFMMTTDMLISLLLVKNLYTAFIIDDLIHYFRIHADPAVVPVKPDGVAKLILPDGKPITLAIEIDLATENEEKIKDKIADYVPYISNGSFTRDYKVGEVPLIVFWTPEEKRRDQLLTWIEKALLENYSGNKASWFRVSCGTLSPELFFERIWITPGPVKERKVTSLFG